MNIDEKPIRKQPPDRWILRDKKYVKRLDFDVHLRVVTKDRDKLIRIRC
jgi:hypothetical protein